MDLKGLIVSKKALVDSLLASVNQTFDSTKGGIVLPVDSDGISVSLDPSSGSPTWYLVGASATVGDPASPGPGYIGVTNVDPGVVTLTTSHPTKTCASINGWTSGTGAPNVEKVIVRAGFGTGLFRHVCQ